MNVKKVKKTKTKRNKTGERQNGTASQKYSKDTSLRQLWLVNYDGDRTGTSMLDLGYYPLIHPSRHVWAYYCVPLSSPSFLCRDPFRHETNVSSLLPPSCAIPPRPVLLHSSRPLVVGHDTEALRSSTRHPINLFPRPPQVACTPHQLFSEHHTP